MPWTSVRDAAALMFSNLDEAQRRIDAGEPLNTTAAEMGYTPGELRELLDAAQCLARENAYKQKWQTIYDNDEQDLY